MSRPRVSHDECVRSDHVYRWRPVRLLEPCCRCQMPLRDTCHPIFGMSKNTDIRMWRLFHWNVKDASSKWHRSSSEIQIHNFDHEHMKKLHGVRNIAIKTVKRAYHYPCLWCTMWEMNLQAHKHDTRLPLPNHPCLWHLPLAFHSRNNYSRYHRVGFIFTLWIQLFNRTKACQHFRQLLPAVN